MIRQAVPRARVAVTALLGMVLSGVVLVTAPAAMAATPIEHPGLVPAAPATGYPIISDQPPIQVTSPNCQGGTCFVPREVLATNQVGRYIVSGGNFRTVELQDGTVLQRPFFTAWNIDTKQIACTSTTFDNEVLKVIPGDTPETFFVAGRFGKITGPDGVVRTRTRIAKLRLPDCSVDTTFVSPSPSGKVDELALVGNRLFAGGDFGTISGRAISTLAELNATTGAVDPNFSFTFSGALSSRVRAMAINPGGNRLIVAGRFGTMSRGGVSVLNPTAVIDISAAAPVLTPHSSTGYTTTQGQALGLKYLQDASISPDGTVVGLAYGTATIADYVYLTPLTEAANTRFTWRHYMRDSSFGIGVTNTAVYVTGHFCRPDAGPGATEEMTPVAGVASTCTGTTLAGGVWRSHLAALSLTDGTPLTWNPGNESFRGGQVITVTKRGLLIGFDGERTATIRTGALSFFDFGSEVEDFAPPSDVTITSPAADATVGNPATITGSATDDLQVGSFRIAVRAADGQYVQADGELGAARHEFTPVATAAGAFSQQTVMPAGTYTIEAVAVDVVGKVSANVVTRSFVQSGLDGVRPATTVVVNPATADAGQAITVSGVARDNEQLTQVRLRITNAAGQYLTSNGTFSAAATNYPLTMDVSLPASEVSWSATLPTTLPLGNYAVAARMVDVAGNAFTGAGTVRVAVTPPSVSITSPGPLVAFGQGASLAGVVTDNAQVAAVDVSVTNAAGSVLQDDGTFGTVANTLPVTVTGLGTASASFEYLTGVLPVDDYTVRVTGVDAGGASTSATATFHQQSAVTALVSAYSGFSTTRSTGTNGYSFTVPRLTTVQAIGVHDTNRNGRINNSQATGAAIWRQGNTTPLATVSVPANAVATNGWAYADLATPLVLSPGITYVVGAQSFGLFGEAVASGGTATLVPGITITSRASVSSFFSSLTYPENFSTGTGYGMPNLRFQQ
jgi:Bacterial Ig domain